MSIRYAERADLVLTKVAVRQLHRLLVSAHNELRQATAEQVNSLHLQVQDMHHSDARRRLDTLVPDPRQSSNYPFKLYTPRDKVLWFTSRGLARSTLEETHHPDEGDVDRHIPWAGTSTQTFSIFTPYGRGGGKVTLEGNEVRWTLRGSEHPEAERWTVIGRELFNYLDRFKWRRNTGGDLRQICSQGPGWLDGEGQGQIVERYGDLGHHEGV